MRNSNDKYIKQKRLSVVDGKINEHRLENGMMGIYSDSRQRSWSLTKGDFVEIYVSVEPIDDEDKGCLLWGFYKEGRFRLAGSVCVKEEAVIEFIAPEDGEYRFFFLCGSLHPVQIRSIRFAV